jgi:uncharacterized membrane protein YdfJ with MMPL/SSD domain
VLLAGAITVTGAQLGAWAGRVSQGSFPESISILGNVLDTLLFVACALTYLATAAIAGIPAMPWLMPYFLGVVSLRRGRVTEI